MVSLQNVTVTVYENITSKKSHHRTLSAVLERIRNGSKALPSIIKLRSAEPQLTSDEKAALKQSLPSICFSGLFEGPREDKALKQHSGLVILDFDHLKPDTLQKLKADMVLRPHVVTCFISPSGDGLKVLVRILDTTKHRQHYKALMRELPGLDEKNINEARVCFESYDPDIYINYDALPYALIVEIEKKQVKVSISNATGTDFGKIEKWLDKQNNIYQSGNRNNFIFCLASACCRFGIKQDETHVLIEQNYLSKDSDFTQREAVSAIESAYKRNTFASATFDKEILVEKSTAKEVVIDLSPEVTDVIYGKQVFNDAKALYLNGYVSAETTGIKSIDTYFKWKRGEITLLTGIGNFGKSEWLNFMMLNKSATDGTKWAIFGPESYPAEEFYHNLVEMSIGCNCTPKNVDGSVNYNRPPERIYDAAYNWVSKHFFYIYPKTLSPTPEYIGSRFLELIMKEKVDGCVIDPFNQLSNDYGLRDDKYLETFLAECKRFSQINNTYYIIVAHPHKLQKDKETKAYPEPDVFDLAGGAMWNNKTDNILVYHRPFHHIDPMDRRCTLSSKKVKRQKVVGIKGSNEFEYDRVKRRFVFDEGFALLNMEFNAPAQGEFTTQKEYGIHRLPTSTGQIVDYTEAKKGEYYSDDDFKS